MSAARHGGLPRRSPRSSSRCPSTRRSSTSPEPCAGSVGRASSASTIRARVADEQGITCSVGVATHEVRRQAGVDAGQAGRAARRAARRRRRVPAPAAGRRALGRGRAHRGGADPARAAHGRRPRARPRRARWSAPSAPAAGAHLAALAWGRDERRVVPQEPDKSIGAEETFATDVDDPTVIHRELLRLSRARRPPGCGRRATPVARSRIKVRFADFTTITRSRTLRERHRRRPGDLRHGPRAYDALGLERARIRLVGVRVEGLIDADGAHRSSSLLDAPERGWREAELAVDRAVAALRRRGRTPGRAGPPGSRPARERGPGRARPL